MSKVLDVLSAFTEKQQQSILLLVKNIDDTFHQLAKLGRDQLQGLDQVDENDLIVAMASALAVLHAGTHNPISIASIPGFPDEPTGGN